MNWVLIFVLTISDLSYLTGSPLTDSSQDTPSAADGRAELQPQTDKIYALIWSRFTKWTAPSPCIKTPSYGNDTFVCGVQMYTINARPISSFLGIKYGVSKRFQPPNPPGKYWNGNLTANRHGPVCSQMNIKTQLIFGQEDCLYLNVFVPKLTQKGKPLPVMVFIHGGSFVGGSSNFYSPSYLLDRDVILVTFNYRLGPLGFFNLGNNDAPGNAGLYDQFEVLKWVQSHIQDFGGDQSGVTLIGQSAGSASANILMLNPLAKGLFHRAILHSGTAVEKWSVNENSLADSLELASAVGCRIDDYAAVIKCMKEASIANLIQTLEGLIFGDRVRGEFGVIRTAPAIQSAKVSNPCLHQHPKALMDENKMADVPLMIGATKHEGSFVLGIAYMIYFKLLNHHNNSEFLKHKLIPEYLVKNTLGFDESNGAISKSLESLYCRGIDLGNFTVAAPCIIDILGVLMFKAGVDEVARLHSRRGSKPAYLYSFDVESNNTLFNFLLGNVDFETGTTHADDLMYLFPLVDSPNQRHLAFKDKMVELWANFATYGDPTPIQNETKWNNMLISKWTPYNVKEQNYMAMADNFTITNNYVQSWSSL